MNFNMNKTRIEAFSDGVIAIIITIMVLELHLPELEGDLSGRDVWRALATLLPELFSYLLSFVVVAILWVNHHALFDKIPHSTSRLVWYNTALLFVMSLIPLPTAFLAAHPWMPQAVVCYGFVMFLNALAFLLLRRYVDTGAKLIPPNKQVRRSNLISTLLYFLSMPLAFISVYLSFVIFIGIPMWYFLPDRFHQQQPVQ